MSPFIIFPSLLLLLLLLHLTYRFLFTKHPKLPPSPLGLPILGNLLQIGPLPHRSLSTLSHKLGRPLFLIRLGQIPILVASSPSSAASILKTHDQSFAGRPHTAAVSKLIPGRNVSFSPYNDYHRQAKKLSVLHLLSPKRVRSFRKLRSEEAALMVGRVRRGGEVINLSEILYAYSNGVVSRAAAGKGSSSGDDGVGRGERFRELMDDASVLVGGFEVDDLFPWLRWVGIGRITGKDNKLEKMGRRWDEFLGGILEEHENGVVEEKEEEEDFVDVLLRLRKEEGEDFVLNENDIKSIVMDMMAAGTDTSYVTLEWAMAELLRNPRVREKLQHEVRNITGSKANVEEDDVEQMIYLKAVVKEVLRLRPPAPLLLMHESTKATQLQGYEIPAKTRVIINAWAIGRDGESWESSEEFRPERFVGSSVDFKGHAFQFIPFGAGRRVCPGMHFAMSTVELSLANLMYHFDWALPEGMGVEDLDMSEAPGLTTPRKIALCVVATPHL